MPVSKVVSKERGSQGETGNPQSVSELSPEQTLVWTGPLGTAFIQKVKTTEAFLSALWPSLLC